MLKVLTGNKNPVYLTLFTICFNICLLNMLLQ